eukprot:CAMPEP_0195337426 /NCGR_PEP_ID=MMETSP0708-20121125/16892_1 /TAXON_ID=33640 /ORGANISM="Asterionellopsis glacialis, Strain CCMP134" /LENGTH=47 /DNA_ID= /DNA_START= /DNA_END= /DNA_ORIENTATION=
MKDVVAADDPEDTAGCTPICNIKGPLTMPPPTPNIPAKNPARQQTSG